MMVVVVLVGVEGKLFENSAFWTLAVSSSARSITALIGGGTGNLSNVDHLCKQ